MSVPEGRLIAAATATLIGQPEAVLDQFIGPGILGRPAGGPVREAAKAGSSAPPARSGNSRAVDQIILPLRLAAAD